MRNSFSIGLLIFWTTYLACLGVGVWKLYDYLRYALPAH
jgi:hypothetical protein